MATLRGKRVVLLSAALALALVVLALATRYERMYQWWWNRTYGVPVVRTWEELRAQPPIELEDGTTIRLGIEATRVPATSGVLAYCLLDAPGAKGIVHPDGERILGPIQVFVANETRRDEQRT